METRRELHDLFDQYQHNFPVAMHLPAHSGEFLDDQYKQLIESHGIMRIDGAIRGLSDAKNFEVADHKLGDAGLLYHQIFNSKLTLFLQNGSTSGNLILAACLAKKKVLIQANSHASLYNGLLLAGCQIVVVVPFYSEQFDVFLPVTAEQIKQVKDRHSDLYAVYITSPNFEGFIANYQQIKQACGQDVLLFVDEAHGASCYFSRLDNAALQNNADASIVSIHKSLGGICGTAIINIGAASRLDIDKVKTNYHIFTTTTPSPIMLTNIESCVIFSNSLAGQQKIDIQMQLISFLKEQLGKRKNITLAKFPEIEQQSSKCLFRVFNMCGDCVESRLIEQNVMIEKATNNSVVLSVHMLITMKDIQKFLNALDSLKVPQELCHPQLLSFNVLFAERVIQIDLRDFISCDVEILKPENSIGRISAEIIFSCPPGFPVIIYGDLITKDHLDFIKERKAITVKRE